MLTSAATTAATVVVVVAAAGYIVDVVSGKTDVVVTLATVLVVTSIAILIWFLLLNRITLGRHKSDNDNRKIQFTYAFCVLFMFNWASNI